MRWTRCPWGRGLFAVDSLPLGEGSVCGGLVALGGRGLFAVDSLPLGEGVCLRWICCPWGRGLLRWIRCQGVVPGLFADNEARCIFRSQHWLVGCHRLCYKKKQVSWPCQPLHFCSHSIVCSLAHGGSLFTVDGTKRVPAEWRRRRDCSETGVSGCRHEGRNRCVVAQSRGERGR